MSSVSPSRSALWVRWVFVGRSSGPLGPWTKARVNGIDPAFQSIAYQRKARSCPRRAPVDAANLRKQKSAGSSSLTVPSSLATCSALGGRISGGGDARRARVRGGVQPGPLPADGLGQRPMKDAVDPGDGTRSKRLVPATTRAEEVAVEVVDVLGGELSHV